MSAGLQRVFNFSRDSEKNFSLTVSTIAIFSALIKYELYVVPYLVSITTSKVTRSGSSTPIHFTSFVTSRILLFVIFYLKLYQFKIASFELHHRLMVYALLLSEKDHKILVPHHLQFLLQQLQLLQH